MPSLMKIGDGHWNSWLWSISFGPKNISNSNSFLTKTLNVYQGQRQANAHPLWHPRPRLCHYLKSFGNSDASRFTKILFFSCYHFLSGVTTFYSGATTFYSVATTFYSGATTFYSVPTTFYSVPTTFYSVTVYHFFIALYFILYLAADLTFICHWFFSFSSFWLKKLC